MKTSLNQIHIGGPNSKNPMDWRHAPNLDPDDEEIKTPSDVKHMLGFDPQNPHLSHGNKK